VDIPSAAFISEKAVKIRYIAWYWAVWTVLSIFKVRRSENESEYSQLARELSNGWVDEADEKHSTSADCDGDVAR
jgi:hypothetical protein